VPIISDELTQDIIRGWRILDTKQHVDDYPCGTPEPEEIDQIIRTAFFASIQREEANFITFSLVFLPTHKDAKPRHNLSEFNEFLTFVNPVDLTVETVRKLADAIDEKTSALAIEKRGTQYMITGIIPFGRSSSLLGNTSGGYPRPEALTVTARSPGSLIISRANSVIGRFVAGEFKMAQATPFHSKALGGDLIDRVSSHDVYGELETGYWHWYASSLQHLLRSTSGRGHGGTIIWLPREITETALTQVALGHQLTEFTPIYDTLLEVLRNEKILKGTQDQILDEHRDGSQHTSTNISTNSVVLPLHLSQLKMKLTTLLNTLAQIACTDGAMLIDEYFVPMRFGARLCAEEWSGPIRHGPTPDFNSSEEIRRSRFGTRHNSAIDFVGMVPGSIAFVLSQDGPVRAITRRNETVCIWPDSLNTVFVD